MGIYLFRRETLVNWLSGEGKDQHVFGRDVIPGLVANRRVFAHAFQGYWDDVGTVQSYWEANMALLAETPMLDLYDPGWIIHTRSQERAAAFIGEQARVEGNLVCDGSRIEGSVSRSVISPGVHVAAGAVVRDSIIMNDAFIGADAVVDRAIIDKQVVIGAGAHIGCSEDNTPNQSAPQRLNTGITLIGKRARIPAMLQIGRNVEIGPDIAEHEWPAAGVPSGATL